MLIHNILMKKLETLNNMIILLILFILVRKGLSQGHQPISISDSLSCNINNISYSIPITSPTNKTAYIITLQLQNTNTLPVILQLFTNIDDLNKFNTSKISKNTQIDIQSIQLNRQIQKLQYVPMSERNAFYVGIFRSNMREGYFADNVDRDIQGYDGKNANFIYNCSMVINFILTIQPIPTTPSSNQQDDLIVVPPLFSSDCKNGKYIKQTRSCKCNFNYGMVLCDVKFNQINRLDINHNGVISSGQKKYFYFESYKDVGIEVIVSCYQNKNVSDGYPKEFIILAIIQSISEPLNAPTIFNQINPHNLNKIQLKQNERLVVAVYRPLWTSTESFTITFNNKKNSKDYLVDIIIAISCGLTLLAISGLIFYLFYCKRKNLQNEMLSRMGIATPVLREGNRKVVNSYFQLDKYFPSISYKQLQQLINQSNQDKYPNKTPFKFSNNECSICLQNFKYNYQIKLTYCGHIFDSNCITQWINIQPSCPLCRKYFNNIQMENIWKQIGIYQQCVTTRQIYEKMFKWIQGMKEEYIPVDISTTHQIKFYANSNQGNI